ncbi:MAG: YgfZ/GcvT domain-containing protein [Bradymonadia bacterium]
MTDNDCNQWTTLDAAFLMQRGASAFIEVTDWVQFEVLGRDVASYLGRLSSYQVSDIADGGGARTFLLDARGKIQATFECYRQGEEFTFMVPSCDVNELLRILEHYHFGEDFKCERVANQCIAVLLGKRALTSLHDHSGWNGYGRFASSDIDVCGTKYRALETERYGQPAVQLSSTAPSAVEALESFCKSNDISSASVNVLNTVRIDAAIAAAPGEFCSDYTPLDVGALDGITDGKGCYPGQEVIERTIALGKPAMVCVPVRSDTTLTAGATVSIDERRVGVVSSAYTSLDGSGVGIAVLKRAHAQREQWSLSGGQKLLSRTVGEA